MPPPNSVIAGIPARVICTLDEYYKKRKEKQIGEALEYAISIQEKGREPKIEDFYEEWCLFVTREEYDSNPVVKHNIDFRLKGYVDVDDYLKQDRPFKGFGDFIKYVNDNRK